MIAPICAGDLLIVTPADSNALILSVAVPLPPAMMAPAWPMRLPGGAVKPAPPQASVNILSAMGMTLICLLLHASCKTGFWVVCQYNGHLLVSTLAEMQV